jgi:acyl dehydratase
MLYEEFTVGQTFRSHDYLLTREHMMDFSEVYDPQPLHLDEAFAQSGPFGELIASGFMSLALAWKLWIELGHHGTHGQGGVALQDVRWFAPLLPDTTVHTEVRVAELRVSSKGRGVITYDIALLDSSHNLLTRFTTVGLVERLAT